MIRGASFPPARRAARSLSLVAAFALGALLGGCTLADLLPGDGAGTGNGERPPEPPAGDGEAPLLQVDAIEVLILESFPVQVHVHVHGTVPDACTEIGAISQRRSDNAIDVTIATTRDPGALCAQVLTPVEETVSLEGDFPPGEYTVSVNGVTETFRV